MRAERCPRTADIDRHEYHIVLQEGLEERVVDEVDGFAAVDDHVERPAKRSRSIVSARVRSANLQHSALSTQHSAVHSMF